ncbi:IclR family transcriptional regulator [Actinophytocola sediminis]
MTSNGRDSDGPTQGGSLTLDRGLRLLELLAVEDRDMTVAELANSLDVHRQAVYRLLATLRSHRFVAEGGSGRYRLGLGVIQLTRQVNHELRRATAPHLRRLAHELSATTQCVVADGGDAVALTVVEPPESVYHLSQHSGARHPLDQGASGLAILMARKPTPADAPALQDARRVGYAVSRGRLTAGAVGVAVPLFDGDGHSLDAAIGIVSMAEVDVEHVARRLTEAAEQIANGDS